MLEKLRQSKSSIFGPPKVCLGLKTPTFNFFLQLYTCYSKLVWLLYLMKKEGQSDWQLTYCCYCYHYLVIFKKVLKSNYVCWISSYWKDHFGDLLISLRMFFNDSRSCFDFIALNLVVVHFMILTDWNLIKALIFAAKSSCSSCFLNQEVFVSYFEYRVRLLL